MSTSNINKTTMPILPRRGTDANKANDYTIQGEIGYLTDQNTLIIGNSSNAWQYLAGSVITKTDTGDPTGAEGLFCINTFDNTFKVYADGAWRSLATW